MELSPKYDPAILTALTVLAPGVWLNVPYFLMYALHLDVVVTVFAIVYCAGDAWRGNHRTWSSALLVGYALLIAPEVTANIMAEYQARRVR